MDALCAALVPEIGIILRKNCSREYGSDTLGLPFEKPAVRRKAEDASPRLENSSEIRSTQ